MDFSHQQVRSPQILGIDPALRRMRKGPNLMIAFCQQAGLFPM